MCAALFAEAIYSACAQKKKKYWNKQVAKKREQ